MIFSTTCIWEQLRKNIICVSGDENINSRSGGDIQAGCVSALGSLRKQFADARVNSVGDSNHSRRASGARISQAANEGPVSAG